MLATAATYQNNLIFAMAFLVISLALIAILQTARNVRDLTALAVHLESNFAGSLTTGTISLVNPASDTKFNLFGYAEFRGGLHQERTLRTPFSAIHVEKNTTNTFPVQVQLPKTRGRYQLHRICISSTAPYGLFQAWIYLQVASELIVYPEANGIRELPMVRVAQGEDFSGHKLYAPGDSMNRIDWKVYSRRKELYVREFRDGAAQQVDLKLDEERSHLEPRLSQLSLWINEAYQKQFEFQLSTRKHASGYGHDKAHFHRCLTELALWTG